MLKTFLALSPLTGDLGIIPFIIIAAVAVVLLVLGLVLKKKK